MKGIEATDIYDCLFLGKEKEFNKDTIVKCPECNEKIKVSEFKETETYCEDCGSHCAIECPKCEEVFDTVYDINDFLIR